jgi:hypothetical protein
MFVLNLDNAVAFRNPKAGAYFPLEDREHPSHDFRLSLRQARDGLASGEEQRCPLRGFLTWRQLLPHELRK